MSRRRGHRYPGSTPLPWDSLYPTLDLHGATAEEARRRARAWLDEQQAGGVRTVRVITGKGNRSRGLPVLRGEIEGLLHSLRGTVVATYATESGGGSFRVELRKLSARRSTGSLRRPASPVREPAVDDPDLRRRAEEALWELGVQPTPELVRAEIRRLREQEADRTG
jgi:hypothetical protein